jgi:HlyD family secretion protein
MTNAPPDTTALNALLGDSAARPWYRRLWPWLLLAALLAAGGGWWWWQAGAAGRAAPVYSTEPVGRGSLVLRVTANGTVQPTRTINIGSELSGTVLKVNVDVNDRVKKGQVLVVLDTAKLRDQVQRSQAALASAQSKVALTTATIAEAQANLGRLNEVARLSGGKVPSAAELDSARATLARAQADAAAARANVQDAQAALSTDQTNLGKASIVAPADGVVLTRSVDPGNAVAASLQAVTLFTIAEDLARLRLWVYVDEADVGNVQLGQEATFTVAAFPRRTFPARITRVGFGSTITENVVTYRTDLDTDNADLSLRPGMTATATITAARHDNVLLVPNTALRFTPGTAAPAAAKGGVLTSLAPRMPGGTRRLAAATPGSTAGTRQVWVLPDDGSNTPVAVAVVPGISDGQMTEVTGGGLKEGMRVITDQKLAVAK